MKNLCLWIQIILLGLQSYVMSEAPSVKDDVLGAVGGAVTLNICHTGTTTITWNFVKKAIIIARTKPQGSLEIDDNNYDGRVSSTSDGSLIITELRLEDQGEYRAQFRGDTETKICDYHLTVFSNLTAEDVTIGSNVTDNKTCEVTLTCLVGSVNGSDVTVTWRSSNSSDVNQTWNVVFVPPRNINFTYVCTAKNPVSNVSKTVVPWRYCNNDTHDYFLTESAQENGISILIKTITGITVFVVVLAIFLFLARIFRKKEKKSEGVNKEKAALKQIANTYEMTGEDCTGNNEALGDETMELQASQSNETTDKSLYSTVLHVKEPQESQSNCTTGNTVYSTVSQPKQKNKQTKQSSPSNGNPSKPPLKPTRQMLESAMDKNKQKSPSERPNGNCSNPPFESCYAEVQLPKDKSYQQAPLESCYAEVQLPKPTEM